MPSVLMYPEMSSSQPVAAPTIEEPSGPPLMRQVFRKSGARPKVANVRLMAHAMSYGAPLSYWYELNLWKTESGSYISDIRLFRKTDEENDEFFLFENEDLDDAVSAFETFNPRHCVSADIHVGDDDTAPADLAIHAIQLRHDLAVATRHYKSVVSNLLKDFE